MAYEPTAEQARAIELAMTGENLVVEAGAGTGKSSTLRLIAEAMPDRKFLYLVFNKAAQVEASQKFPRNVEARTAHSLAFGPVGRNYKHRLEGGRMRSIDIARKIGLLGDPAFQPWIGKGALGDDVVLQPGYLAGLVTRSIRAFCNSDAELPDGSFLPRVEKLDLDEMSRLRKELTPAIREAWKDVSSINGTLPFTHDCYLKLYALGRPQLRGFDTIMFDEAQDASPVMIDLVARQRAQLVVVGDSCQPTGTMVTLAGSPGGRWTGPTPTREVPIEQVRVGDRVVSYDLSGSHLRRTGSVVSGVSSRPFDGELIEVVTAGGLTTSYTPDHHCVVKIGDAFRGKHLVYMMRRGDSFRIGKVAGNYESQGGAFGLGMRASSEKADAAWVLSAHDTHQEALLAEAYAAWSYGVPTLTFVAQRTHALGQAGLDAFWSKIGDNTEQAKACLAAHGRDVRFPLWSPALGNTTRRRAWVTRAANLMDGMLVLPLATAWDERTPKDRKWEAVTVSRRFYSGLVWSMTVEGDHTYVGDGIVTHNCQQIYGWRGAVNALQAFPREHVAWLTQSFRFGQAVAEVANDVLSMIEGAELRITGTSTIDSTVGIVASPDAILCRTNALAVSTTLAGIAAGKRVALVGGANEVVRFAQSAQNLMEGRYAEHPDLSIFNTWDEVLAYVASDALGEDLALLVKLVEDFGPEVIISELGRTVDESRADVVVSTCHKAKGREWGSVIIAGDFPGGEKLNDLGKRIDRDPTPEELRLLYVAVTRARFTLDITQVRLLAGE